MLSSAKVKRFELTILGCGAAAPTPYFLTTSQLVNIHDQLLLIDCGEGTQLSLRKSRIKFQKIKTILISHMHGDHTLGLPGLIASMNLLGRKTSLNVFGPKELSEMVKKVWYLTDTHIDFEVNFIATNSKEIETIVEHESFTIKSFPTKHRIDTCGFRIDEKPGNFTLKHNVKKKHNLNNLEIQKLKRGEDLIRGEAILGNDLFCNPPKYIRSYSFAADTAFSPKVVDAVKGSTLLYHEATFESKDKKIATKTLHSTAQDAARVAAQADVCSLIIGHFSNRYRDLNNLLNEAKEVFVKSELAIEGNTYMIA
ncbi:MAG: ribonuclease Z [Euryarchaeota archaeon]|nr:ribonuclease Z [Euryarchaeota archaeon]